MNVTKKQSEYRRLARKIGKRFLTTDELILLDLMRFDKSTAEIAAFLGLPKRTVRHRKRRIEGLLRAYSWWLDNEETVAFEVKRKSRAHWRVLDAIIHRRPLSDVAKREGVPVSALRVVAKEAVEILAACGGAEFANDIGLKFSATRLYQVVA